jgi:hypothetical protein
VEGMNRTERRAKIESYAIVAVFWALAYAVCVLSLGLVRLKPICEICEHEIELRNVLSHFKWHAARGDWR